MKNCSSYCGFHRVFSPSNQGFQSPSFNSFASTKHISTNPSSSNHQKILSTHNNDTMYNIKKYFEDNTIDQEDNLSDH